MIDSKYYREFIRDQILQETKKIKRDRFLLMVAWGVVLGMLLFTAAFAKSPETVGGYAACHTKEAVVQIRDAAIKKNRLAYNYLLRRDCVITRPQMPLAILQSDWGSLYVKVRIFITDGAFDVWTVRQNIRE